jgi:glucose-6-phosphate 1-epimerase
MDSSLEDHGIQTILHSESGSLCVCHEVGATILSFHPSPDSHSEVLFVSRDAVLNGSKAIRGGIPLVFPIFGPPDGDIDDSDMPQHGFARTNIWRVDPSSLSDLPKGASIDFVLSVDANNDNLTGRGTKGLWAPSEASPACELRYRIVVNANSLTTTLFINNSGTVAFPVQALFHTYYHVHDKAALTKCSVTGLQGYDMVDKVHPENSCLKTTQDVITITQETDRVYSPPADQNQVSVTLQLNRSTPVICTAKGSVDGSPVPVSCVVWNPHEEKAKGMSDFGDDQYHEMICVEPGILGKPMLEPGKQAVLEQVIALEN